MKNTLKKEQFLRQTFETQDINLAASLYALGASLLAIERNNPERCTFVFEDTPGVRKTTEAYWLRQLSLEPQTLLGALKAVKSRLYGEKS
jgi:hypothetical protein